MKTFEVTLKGFDGGTDHTDNLVKWVRAVDRKTLDNWLDQCGLTDYVGSITDIGGHAKSFTAGVDIHLCLTEPDSGQYCVIKNFGDFFQISQHSFYPQTWIAESRYAQAIDELAEKLSSPLSG